jgi:hypothetical protein
LFIGRIVLKEDGLKDMKLIFKPNSLYDKCLFF